MAAIATPRRLSGKITALADDSTPRTPSPRKKPHCTKCGQPMLGHKRGQCPNAISPTAKSEDPKEEKPADLSARLETLKIDDDGRNDGREDAERKACRRSSIKPMKAETLLSLASTDKDALNALAEPGMMTDKVVEVDEQATRENIERWLNSHSESLDVTPKKKTKLRFSMGPEVNGNRRTSTPRPKDPSASIIANVSTARPLGRTDTEMEREAFYSKLVEKSENRVASVYTVSAGDIQELEQHAKQLNIRARAIFPKYADGTTGDGWLVIGQDPDSIERVFKGVESDVKSNNGYLVGGAAAVGAVATWIVLAFA